MTIPKEIVDKMKQVNSLMNEIDKWLDENIDLDGSKHDHRWMGKYTHQDWYQFANEAIGEEQDDGEYCDQRQVNGTEDSYKGTYYYPTEDGEYFYFEFLV